MYKYKMHDKMVIASQKWQLIKIVFFYFYFFLKINLYYFIFPTQKFPKICFPPNVFHLAFPPTPRDGNGVGWGRRMGSSSPPRMVVALPRPRPAPGCGAYLPHPHPLGPRGDPPRPASNTILYI